MVKRRIGVKPESQQPSGYNVALWLVWGGYPLTKGDTAMNQTPNYIKSLLLPSTKSPQGRKVWSIDLEQVWLPFFLATNAMSDTAIPSDALGCPIRLAFDKDGSVRFGKNGRPVTRVAKPLSQSVSLVRENFVATLKNYAEGVATDCQKDYALQVELAQKAGLPIAEYDREAISKAIQLQIEQAVAQAEAHEPTPEPTPEPVPTPKVKKELVTA